MFNQWIGSESNTKWKLESYPYEERILSVRSNWTGFPTLLMPFHLSSHPLKLFSYLSNVKWYISLKSLLWWLMESTYSGHFPDKKNEIKCGSLSFSYSTLLQTLNFSSVQKLMILKVCMFWDTVIIWYLNICFYPLLHSLLSLFTHA